MGDRVPPPTRGGGLDDVYLHDADALAAAKRAYLDIRILRPTPEQIVLAILDAYLTAVDAP